MAFHVIWRDNGYPTSSCHKTTMAEALRVARAWAGGLTEKAVTDLQQGEQIVVGDCETLEIFNGTDT